MKEVSVIARPHLEKIINRAVSLGPARVAVTYPCSASSIEATVTAQRMGLIEPILIGPRRRIESIAEEQQFDVSRMVFVETGDDPVSAAQGSIALCQEDKASLIMKGSLHTDELLAVVVGKDSGLRTARRMSHAFVFDLPDYSGPLLMADCVVNINPSLIDKRDITQNAIDLAHTLGIERPYVGILSAIETINPAIPGTIEAAALSKMAERGQITGAVVDVFSLLEHQFEAAKIKGIDLHNRGRPDILIMPNLEAGNMLYKQLVYLAHAECAGIVLGTRVPIVLTSRADSPESRVASCALAVLQARGRSDATRNA